MAKATIYPSVIFNENGKFCGYHVRAWPPYGDEEKHGGAVGDGGSITVHLKPIEVEIPEVPLAVLEGKAVDILHTCREKVRAEHSVLMTRYQMTENALLRISAPEVLDRVETVPYRSTKPSLDDDMPF